MLAVCSALCTGANAHLDSHCIGVLTCLICLYSGDELLPWSEYAPSAINPGVGDGRVLRGGVLRGDWVTEAPSSFIRSRALVRGRDRRRHLTLDLARGRTQLTSLQQDSKSHHLGSGLSASMRIRNSLPFSPDNVVSAAQVDKDIWPIYPSRKEVH